MKDWTEFKLGDIADIQTGPFGSQLHQRDYVSVGTPCIMPTNIGRRLNIDTTNIAHVKDDDVNRLKRHCVKEGDIIYSRRGDIEKCAYILPENEGWLCGTGCLRIRINNNSMIPRFIAYQLSTQECKKWIVGNAVGSTMLNLNTSILKELPLNAPDFIHQKEIVLILKSLDDKIELNRRINDNLEQQAQALFKSWFVDFEPFKDQLFVESELGMIPQGWKIQTLNDACIKVTDGSHFSPKDNPQGTIPMLSVKDMHHNGFDYSSCKLINEEEFQKMRANDCVPLRNDILVAKDGSYLKEIFMCIEEEKQAILSSIAIFRCNKSIIYPELLLQLLRLPKVRKDVGDNYVSGSALPRIVLKDFRKYRFVVAPIEIQNKMINTFRTLNFQIYNNELESRRLAELRDALLPRLMSGEIKVEDVTL